jgi:hypothetical protein
LIAPELAPRALERVAVDILIVNMYVWGLFAELLRCIEENPDDFAAALQGLLQGLGSLLMFTECPGRTLNVSILLLSHLFFCGKDACVSGASGCSASL